MQCCLYASFVGGHNEYQPKGDDALRLGVKAGMVRVWMTGNTVWCLQGRHAVALE